MPTKILECDLAQLPSSLELAGLESYDTLRLHLFKAGRMVGKLTFPLHPVPPDRTAVAGAIENYCAEHPSQMADPPDYPNPAPQLVSVIVPTRDRPADLERCLQSLLKLESRYPFEIIVSDNHPATGQSEAVARRYPVKYVAETRPGASYARNAALGQASGQLVAFTDDDVVVMPGWLDNLLAPFSDPQVMCVTGLVLPVALETYAQELFEQYGDGGLDRGYQSFSWGPEDFRTSRRAVKTWLLGGTANCAVRASAFTMSEIGPFDERLGPGSPAGIGEDTYLFYRILKAGYRCHYQPAALVYHHHRQNIEAFRRQLLTYSKGIVAQQLHILLTEGDKRALTELFWVVPSWQAHKLFARLRGRYSFPLGLLWLEIWGNLAGGPGYWRSRYRAKRLGRTTAGQLAASQAAATPLAFIPAGSRPEPEFC